MAFGLTSPFPYDVPVSPETMDRDTGRKTRSPYFSQEHIDWWLDQKDRVDRGPERIGTVSLTAQSADIGATPVPMPELSAGNYLVHVYTRVTRAATTSSELVITIGWTEGSQALTSAGATLNGNTVTTFEQRTLFLKVDANASITYTADYTSVGATAMQFEIEIVVQKLPN